MSSSFFIERPIFAAVVSLLIVVMGLFALSTLPVARYPEILPPTVEVRAVYPGANATVVEETVAALIENEVNGVEGMLYMSSTSAGNGTYELAVTFEVGTNLDLAQVLVQNRVATVEPRLPEEVRRQGVAIKKKSPSIVLVVALTSPEHEYDGLFIHNYATLRIKDELARLEGVGEVDVFGSSNYSMRVWVNPDKLKARSLSVQDLLAALSEQNRAVAAGQIGEAPVPAGQEFQYSIDVAGRLVDAAQFEEVIVKTGPDDRITRLRDVARVELGARNYNQYFETRGQPAAGIYVYQLPGANGLDIARRVRETLSRLSADFPPGLHYSIAFDHTRFIDASIERVYRTLAEAAVLVFLVLFLFLQNWRATIIATVTIPVSLVGTFAMMALLGLSINLSSLFAIVLAIGVVVDDVIVVVENVWQHMEKAGIAAKEATIRAMSEVSGAIVATTLVLVAVFVPTAFLPGITGELWRQFGLTIAVATVLSSLNALTLSPALCALILRPPHRGMRNLFFRLFNSGFGLARRGYSAVLGAVVRRTALMLMLFVLLASASWWGFISLPTGFFPTEDQGFLIVAARLPDAASQDRTRAVVRKVDAILRNVPGVAAWYTMGGLSILDGAAASNAASFYVVLDDWSQRTSEDLSLEAIANRMRREFQETPEALLLVLNPPAIRGLGTVGGFDMRVQDRERAGHQELLATVGRMVREGNSQSGLARVYSNFRGGVPQISVKVDRTKAISLGIPLHDVFGTLQTYLGSSYVNDFNKFGKTYQVRVQAEPDFRAGPEDIRRLEVRNRKGEMVPLGTLITVERTLGPQVIHRYNMHPAATLNGIAAPGFSSGQALAVMEGIAARILPRSAGYEWTAESFQEKRVSGRAVSIFGLSLLLVYLILAAQYESWTSPLAVIVAVPLALLGTVGILTIMDMDNNLYTQIGIVLLIGLAAKNAILIVEYAGKLHAEGRGPLAAATEAARLRFRPILMTALTFIFSVLPLVFATGAGAAAQRALGTAVAGGMIAATLLSLVFVPVFYIVCQQRRSFRGS